MLKILMPIGDATEALDTFYAYYRLPEDGYEVVVAGPEARLYHTVLHEIPPNPDVPWDITQEQTSFSESSQSTNLNLGGAVDISLPIPTLSVNLNGDYSTRTMNTHATQVSNLQGVTIEFDQIETNIEGKQANYSVTPFVNSKKLMLSPKKYFNQAFNSSSLFCSRKMICVLLNSLQE